MEWAREFVAWPVLLESVQGVLQNLLTTESESSRQTEQVSHILCQCQEVLQRGKMMYGQE